MARRRFQDTSRASTPSRRTGLLITVEGIEGSGKSTQARLLAQHMQSRGLRVMETREPGGTPVAEQIRDMFLRPNRDRHKAETLSPQCEAALILAARSQHVVERLLPALRQGVVVICDRFSDSTLAYQGFGRGLPLPDLRRLIRWAAQGLTPDVTFLFDLPVAQGLRRRLHHDDTNRLDRETTAFHQRVRRGFLALAQQHTRRIHTIPAGRSVHAISRQLIDIIDPLLTAGLRTRRLAITKDMTKP